MDYPLIIAKRIGLMQCVTVITVLEVLTNWAARFKLFFPSTRIPRY